MPQDDQTTASLAAKLRAEIRAELVAGLAIPPRVVAQPQPAARGAATPTRIPGTEGRPELLLPEGASLSGLTLPASLKAGVTVSYKAADSARVGGVGGVSGIGYLNANVNSASATFVSIDVRRFVIIDPRSSHAMSIGALAVVGDAVSAGIHWVHPVLLALVSGDTAPKQSEGVTVNRLPFEAEGAKFNAVRIAQDDKSGSTRSIYDLETGWLLSQISTITAGANTGHVLQTYLSHREQQIPWAQQPVPDWVGGTRSLTFQGGNTIVLAGTTLRQSVTLSADLEQLSPGVVLSRFTVVTDSGIGYPDERSSWEMVCATAMIYPLWIAPAALQELRPHQRIDDDPVTGFRMTFTGIEGDYATLLEEGPLERTVYFYDVRNGMISGFRGQRPFGDGGGQIHTETWLHDRR